MKLRAVLATLTLLGTLALGSGLEASAADSRPELGCGSHITTDAVLRHDLDCHNGWLLVTNSSSTPITIDLQGHTWRTGTPASNIEPVEIYGNVTIKHGTLDVAAIALTTAKTDEGITFSRVHATGFVGNRIGLDYSSIEILNSRIDGALNSSGTTTIANSRIGNGLGIYMRFQGTYSVDITNSTFVGGAQIVSGFGDNFCGCSANIIGTVAHNTFSNSVRGTGDGLTVFGDFPAWPMTLSLTGNRFLDNAGNGLSIKNLGTGATLKNNVARRNGGAGIVLTGAAAIDAGGNRARGNAVSPQCVGVAC
jgi:parallel beta-helix repeat protein